MVEVGAFGPLGFVAVALRAARLVKFASLRHELGRRRFAGR